MVHKQGTYVREEKSRGGGTGRGGTSTLSNAPLGASQVENVIGGKTTGRGGGFWPGMWFEIVVSGGVWHLWGIGTHRSPTYEKGGALQGGADLPAHRWVVGPGCGKRPVKPNNM